MSYEPRATPISPGDVRVAARRQVRTLSAGLLVALGAGVALTMVVVLVALDYKFDQDAHRLFKLLLGAAGVVTLLVVPRIGLFLLPIAIPFLGWMPRIPIPMLNAVNILVFAVFGAWLVPRIIARDWKLRGGQIAPVIGVFVVVSILAFARGMALPVSTYYSAGDAFMNWFRAIVPFSVYFMAIAMLRGAADRRRMALFIAIAVGLEGAVTVALHGNGSAGRSIGSFDQPNVLGTYLATVVCVTAAMVRGVRAWPAKLALLFATALGLAGLMGSVSRGAIVAVAVALFYVALRSSRVMTIVLLLGVVTSPLWAPQDVKDRMMSTQVEVEGSDEVKLEASAQKRIDTWEVIMRTVGNHPIDGVGWGAIGSVLVAEGEGQGVAGIARTAHNTILRMMGECGVFGLLAFLWIFWACFQLAERGVRSATDRFDRQIAVGLGGATLALAVSCWFGDRFFDIGLTGTIWLLAAMVQDQIFERRAGKAA